MAVCRPSSLLKRRLSHTLLKSYILTSLSNSSDLLHWAWFSTLFFVIQSRPGGGRDGGPQDEEGEDEKRGRNFLEEIQDEDEED